MTDENLAVDLAQIKRAVESLRRDRTHVPYVVEFTGLPKAGKTTIIRRLRHILEANKLTVAVVKEAATDKVPKEFRSDLFAFNVLCALENVGSVLRAVLERGASDVVILDRGIFDSLVWLEFLSDSGLLNDEMRAMIGEFLMSKPWFSQIDLIVNVSVSLETYLLRSGLDSAVPSEARFYPDYFDRLGKAYVRAQRRLNTFPAAIRPRLTELDTSADVRTLSDDDARSRGCLVQSIDLYDHAAIELANIVSSGILVKNTEKIAVIDAHRVHEDIRSITTEEKMDDYVHTLFGHNLGTEFEKDISISPSPRVQYKLREDAERDESLVQLVAAAYLVRGGKYLTLKRSLGEKREQLRGKRTILISGHVDSKDQALAAAGRNEIENCLLRELSEELSHFDRPRMRPRFVFRMGDAEMGAHHMGFVYEIQTNSDRVKVRMLPGAGNFEQEVSWLTIEELDAEKSNMDDWSRLVVDRLRVAGV